jgi:hypothetical protein
LLHGAAACVHMWTYNRLGMTEFFLKGEWLLVWLEKNVFSSADTSSSLATYLDNAAQEMLRLQNRNQLFSILQFQLARTGSSANLQSKV